MTTKLRPNKANRAKVQAHNPVKTFLEFLIDMGKTPANSWF